METLKYISKAKLKLVNDAGFETGKIGKLLGSGAEGKVYEYMEDRIIKVISKKNLIFPEPGELFLPLMKHLKKTPHKLISKVYGYGTFYVERMKYYYYISEKLNECKGINKMSGAAKCKEEWMIQQQLRKISLYFNDNQIDKHLMEENDGNRKIKDINWLELI